MTEYSDPKSKLNFQMPFDLYDFFGYLFPGVLFVVWTSIALYIFRKTEYLYLISFFPENLSFIHGIFYFIIGIVCLYILGHSIATISSLLFDRMIVSGIFGYPYMTLLRIDRKKREYHEAAYKYTFTLLNIIPIFAIIIPYGNLRNWVVMILSALMILIILLRVALEFSRHFIAQKIKDTGNNKWVRILLFPDTLLLTPFVEACQRIMRTNMAFPEEFIKRIKKSFELEFQIKPENARSENYWLSYYRATSNSTYHTGLIRTWLHLYAFARNICCVFYMFTYVFSFNSISHNSTVISLKLLILINFMLAIIFFLRYWVLYYIYYSKSVFRVYLNELRTSPAPNPLPPSP